MLDRFRGEFGQKIDAKARVSVPSSFRRVLEAGDPAFKPGGRARMVLVYGDARRSFCQGFTIVGMEELEQRIDLLPTGSPQRKLLVLNFTRMSLEIEIDEDGRIVLPPRAREKIGLGGAALKDGSEVMFAGGLDTFELWNRLQYDAESNRLDATTDDVVEPGADLLTLLPPRPDKR
jgi:MraZ protein